MRVFYKLILNDPNVNMYVVNVNGQSSIVNWYNTIVDTECTFF